MRNYENREELILAMQGSISPFEILYGNKEYYGDKEILLTGLERGTSALKLADKVLLNDKNFMFDAVSKNGNALKYASEKLKGDKGLVLQALKNDNSARCLRFADPKLLKDENFALDAVKINGFAIFEVDPVFEQVREIVKVAAKQNGAILGRLNRNYANDEEIALSAIKSAPMSVHDLGGELIKNKDFLVKAIKVMREQNYNGYSYELLKDYLVKAVTEDMEESEL